MKELIVEYGQYILAFLVIAFTLPNLSLAMDRGALLFHAVDPVVMQDVSGEEYEAYASDGYLEMCYTNVPISEGKNVKISDHLQANGSGKDATIKICAVFDENGTLIRGAEQQNNPSLRINNAGVYTVFFLTKDALGRTQYGRLKIPVQRGMP